MLVPYGYFEREEQLCERLQEAFTFRECVYCETDLMTVLTYEDRALFESIIEKAMDACTLLNIPVELHFRPLYEYVEQGLRLEYRLSQFACCLITINADSVHPAVAQAQIALAMFSNKLMNGRPVDFIASAEPETTPDYREERYR